MQKIKSFIIDHDKHNIGFYLSGVADGIYTYDLRFRKPNKGNYLSNPSMHSIEHLFATVIRNSMIKDKVVYFGPMGCRTGFYLLLNNIEFNDAKSITIECMKKCLKLNEIPGARKKECGNYSEHNLMEAKKDIQEYLNNIE